MHYIWPLTGTRVVDDLELEQLYRYPADPKWLAVNYVSSADGAVEIDGRSAGLSNPADRQVYQLGSDLADVVLLGAGTATIEVFRGVHPDEKTAERRRRHGLSEIPPIAVVTTGRSLPPDAPVITEAAVPTLVLTCSAAPKSIRDAWTAAGAEVVVAGTDTVDVAGAVDHLVKRGLGRIDCEGGPRLFGSLLAAGMVDELRLTVSPLLVSGAADRIAVGAGIEPAALELTSLLAEGNTLLLRYLVKQ
ncbi:pyrimidine reductase family protein [Phytoactinopolyspora mesophila]|uniref:Pyrimidine reductase family protein n=1 Tax=Phytoactinopolyspora mesophila TaxID=2650750 RepID=A0A7K3M8R9_9ACTN|nr:pyrimidine reductase family protein [Phytoactinopolyspora mesophila]NDL59751.1 pyrimidine reductase family protein [Phytoactinopolyspora mesophila]